MQGSSSVTEDNRQPPYLSPIDLAKILYNTQTTGEEHHHALLRFCSRFDDQAGALFWKPFSPWIRHKLGSSRLEDKVFH